MTLNKVTLGNLLGGIYGHCSPREVISWVQYQSVAEVCTSDRECSSPFVMLVSYTEGGFVEPLNGPGRLVTYTYTDPVKKMEATPSLFLVDMRRFQTKYIGMMRIYRSRIAPTIPHVAARGSA